MQKILYFISFLLIIYPAISCCAISATIRIVENGQPKACIVIASDASEQVSSAAKKLQEYIKKASEADLPVKKSCSLPLIDDRIHIWIGSSNFTPKIQPILKRIDDDGFVISFLSPKDIVIVGPTDWGTEFGVYEFLERYIGIRWLIPGRAGVHIPIVKTIDIPSQEVQQEPVFFSRQLSGLSSGAQSQWARYNRMHGRVNFHHNLNKLFPPEKYTKTHPEFFPLYKKPQFETGKRYLPSNNKIYGWQPCFTAQGLVEESIRNICEYFKKNPEATSYSLGVNDSIGHCECDKCRSIDSGKINYVGRKDLSDRYFIWANAVVEGVLEEYPDKWFGCLAYNEIAEPPINVEIHPQIVPYMTYDRMKWVDKNIEHEGFKITERWAQKARLLGWYDYIYGTPYMLPRVYFHKRLEYYKYAATHGVRAMYAEAYPNWGEGPKLYITLKLLWNPDQDVSELLNEWYVTAVGEKAAPYLAAYYKLWENFWTERIPKGHWFKKGSQFLAFNYPEYLDQVAFDDIEKSRYLLESVVNNAQTEKEKIRARYLIDAFDYYEACALSYLGLKMGVRQTGKNIEYYQKLNNRRYELVKKFQKDIVLNHPIRFDDTLSSKNFLW